ncbi:uncharacterized protein K452DRAFT_62788 [Aplosporella prunicola CBS 121167]|uniref:Uncharacterized protein n=1 Tax=Aplosporella prunicola CBS 121167 TaxID=1176127 RepID=A0A6A6B7R8_9PEZI|nr:uncharacterized protein K452DRAFT_62788 [Aplosporella prunicola CBS 121167]KAF2139608.1 hypothetical protein K452DRAFT_62788 [Aplosporella prunicola CBS 121167]
MSSAEAGLTCSATGVIAWVTIASWSGEARGWCSRRRAPCKQQTRSRDSLPMRYDVGAAKSRRAACPPAHFAILAAISEAPAELRLRPGSLICPLVTARHPARPGPVQSDTRHWSALRSGSPLFHKHSLSCTSLDPRVWRCAFLAFWSFSRPPCPWRGR